jgi:hypothetical protein
MDRFQDGNFCVKESILTIFCNFVMNHARELERCDEFLEDGQERVAVVASPKYTWPGVEMITIAVANRAPPFTA